MKWNSKIGLGSVQFGLPYGISNTTGQTSDEEVSKILDIAFHHGVTIIDTAASYGVSEKILGRYTRNRFKIVSKFMPSNQGVSIKEQFENSLEALQTSHLHGYLAHRPLELITNKKDWEDIQELKTAQKISKIGFSLNDPKEYFQLLEAEITPDIVQVPFNYFDSRFKEILVELKSKGCEIHTRSTFLQGLFFKKVDELVDFFDDVKPTVEFLQNSFGDCLQAALLNYVIQQKFIDVVIVGVETSEQLINNFESVGKEVQLPLLSMTFSEQILKPSNWPKIKTHE